MTLVPESRGAYFVEGFNNSSDRIIKGANVYFIDSDTAETVEVDSIVLQVYDGDDVVQYTLTTASTPAIELESPSLAYVVNEIDVTGFVDGDISLVWTGTVDGYEYISTQNVAFNNTPDMVFVSGATATLQDFDVNIGTAKVYNHRIVDSLENPVNSYAARGVFYDRLNATIVETVSATFVADGLWTFTHTLADDDYDADTSRYQIYWEFQLASDGQWFYVENSANNLRIYLANSNIKTGRLTYNTNQSVRLTFPGIDAFLEQIQPNQGERELILDQIRWEASVIIYEQTKNTRRRMSADILKLWADYECVRLAFIKARGFAAFAVNDTQLEEIDKAIKRIKGTLFGSISTVRIGPRSALGRFD